MNGLIVVDRHFDGERMIEAPACLELRGGKIKAVHSGDELPGLPVIHDARGDTLLPGFIDAHAHVGRTGLFEPVEPPNFVAIARNQRRMLEGGVTTVGDMGGSAALSRQLARAAEGSPHAGPALRAAGPLLTNPAGYPLDWMPARYAALGVVLTCSSDREGRQAVQRVADAGMNHVKICVMHSGYDYKSLTVMSPDTAKGIVDEAHRLGLRVMAHAHWAADYRVALDAGVDALVHSSFDPLDEELVERVRDSGVDVCPTLWVFHSACLGPEQRWDRDPTRGRGVTPSVRRSWRRFAEAWAASQGVVPPGIAGGVSKDLAREGVRNALANLRLLHDAKVPLSFGSDGPFGFSVLGRVADELSIMKNGGLSAQECLAAATSGSAQLLGCSDRGRIAAGMRADLVVISGDPLLDLDNVRNVKAVFRGGERIDVARGRRARAAAIVKGIAGTVTDALRHRA